MKLLVLFTIIAVAAAVKFEGTEEQQKLKEQYARECIKEGNVDPAEIGKIKNGDFSNKDESIQCFAKCFFTKAEFMDADGNFNEKIVKAKLAEGLGEEKAGILVDACKNEKGANSCETAYKIYECYHNNKIAF